MYKLTRTISFSKNFCCIFAQTGLSMPPVKTLPQVLSSPPQQREIPLIPLTERFLENLGKKGGRNYGSLYWWNITFYLQIQSWKRARNKEALVLFIYKLAWRNLLLYVFWRQRVGKSSKNIWPIANILKIEVSRNNLKVSNVRFLICLCE